MAISFLRRVWQNYPTTTTPVDAPALNRLEDAVQAVVDASNLNEQNLTKKADLSGTTNTLPVAQMPPGSVLYVHWGDGPNAWPAARPTTRQDIVVIADAPSGTAAPAWLLVNNNDRYETF